MNYSLALKTIEHCARELRKNEGIMAAEYEQSCKDLMAEAIATLAPQPETDDRMDRDTLKSKLEHYSDFSRWAWDGMRANDPTWVEWDDLKNDIAREILTLAD